MCVPEIFAPITQPRKPGRQMHQENSWIQKNIFIFIHLSYKELSLKFQSVACPLIYKFTNIPNISLMTVRQIRRMFVDFCKTSRPASLSMGGGGWVTVTEDMSRDTDTPLCRHPSPLPTRHRCNKPNITFLLAFDASATVKLMQGPS